MSLDSIQLVSHYPATREDLPVYYSYSLIDLKFVAGLDRGTKNGVVCAHEDFALCRNLVPEVMEPMDEDEAK